MPGKVLTAVECTPVFQHDFAKFAIMSKETQAMSHQIELPDTVYNTLLKIAEQEGTTPAEWIAEQLPHLPSIQDRQNGTATVHGLGDNASDLYTNAWDVLDALTGTVDAPEDWSSEHDHYITGSPKRHKEANG
jgi:hypothetical protein